MPTDTSATDYEAVPRTDRTLPAGAGLALAVIGGSVIWGGILALFLI